MANYRIGLSDYIKKLEEYRDNPIKIIKKTIFEITYAILWQMAKHTIVDTGQARSAIIEEFAKKYKFDYSDLMQENYRYWETHGYPENSSRDWGNADSNLSEEESKKNYSININIKDEGLYAQEYASGKKGGSVGGYKGKRYPSIKNDKRDNSNYKIRHITYVSDLINTGNFGSLEKLDYEKLINKLVDNIEYFLFTK